jgi:DNA polymerase-3 subunit beta
MKLSILKEKLKNGLSIVERAVSKSASLPVLNNILLNAEKNFLNLNATDLEIGIKWWGLCGVEKEGKALLPSKILSPLINYLPEKPISLETQNSFLKIKTENYRTNLKSLNYEEFPIIPVVSNQEYILVSGVSLSESLKKVAGFSSPSTTKPEISGVFLILKRNLIKMTATDSFRLGEKTLFFKKPTEIEKEYGLIIPQKAAREMINIFGDEEREIRLYISPNQITVESQMEEVPHPEIQFTSRLIEGEFPDYEMIIPKKYETEVIVPKDEFLNQTKTASIFVGRANEVKLKIDPVKGNIEISSENPDFGKYSSSVNGKIKGKGLEISFNYRFLIEGIFNIEGKELLLGLTNEEGPAVLKPTQGEDYFYILMPVKTT